MLTCKIGEAKAHDNFIWVIKIDALKNTYDANIVTDRGGIDSYKISLDQTFRYPRGKYKVEMPLVS